MSRPTNGEASSLRQPTSRRQRVLKWGGLLSSTAALSASGGTIGGGVGAALLLFGLVLSEELLFAVAHLGLLAVFPEGPTTAQLALVELGLIPVLVSPSLRSPTPGRIATATVVLFAVLGAVTWETLTWLEEPLPVAGVLLLICAAIAYGLHRSELVALGLAEEAA
ncbi:hypothetical protein [Halegenticoccus tardaugens]|uniref:hypothetical protein n=1 Tax=Halegenticoccus tardaugens TaxID=2071624 RepID=UPI00100C072D|nr:hypothetical protein [Halegenticoccus tardaugens]